jgi:hypothetical protein
VVILLPEINKQKLYVLSEGPSELVAGIGENAQAFILRV